MSKATPMTNCTTRFRSAPKVAPVPRKPFIERIDNTANHPLRSYIYELSISRKLFRPNIVFINSELTERLTRRCHHHWRTSYVIDWTSHNSDLCKKHLRTDVSGFPLPTCTIVATARERRNKPESWIDALQLPKRVNEG